MVSSRPGNVASTIPFTLAPSSPMVGWVGSRGGGGPVWRRCGVRGRVSSVRWRCIHLIARTRSIDLVQCVCGSRPLLMKANGFETNGEHSIATHASTCSISIHSNPSKCIDPKPCGLHRSHRIDHRPSSRRQASTCSAVCVGWWVLKCRTKRRPTPLHGLVAPPPRLE